MSEELNKKLRETPLKPPLKSISGELLMTGEEWYKRFEKELYKPPKQEYPHISEADDGESHDRFFRVGGMQFMYRSALKAARKASGL